MANSLSALTQEKVRAAFDYLPDTGRLVRVARGRGARVGVEVGSVDPLNGHRRAYFGGGNRMTAHLVWLWHHGEMPTGILRHSNGANSDDRIENLELLKKQFRVVYVRSGVEVSEYGRLPTHITSGVYEIFCAANGRRYVGSAVSISARWRLHYTQLCAGKHHSRHLQRAWAKHGESEFVFRVLETCEKAALIGREQHYIDTLTPEFNSRPNAASQLGFKPSDASRQRMRAARAGKSSAMLGRRHTPEALARMSESRKGKGCGPRSAEWKESIAASLKGRIITPEQRAKISATLMGHKQSAEQIEKRVLKLRGRKMPEGFAEAASQRMKGVRLSATHSVNIGRSKAKLTEDQVREIRKRREAGESRKLLSEEFCIDAASITNLVARVSYAWVP